MYPPPHSVDKQALTPRGIFHFQFWLLLCAGWGLAVSTGEAQSPGSVAGLSRSSTATYEIGDQGPHHREWLRVVRTTDASGRTQSVTNTAYVELATGMNVLRNGAWTAAREEFVILPDGYAVAGQGQHTVVISPILNDAEGAVSLETPDGKRMRSTILGLALRDRVTGQNLLIAEIKETLGRRVSPNAILFENCFDDVRRR